MAAGLLLPRSALAQAGEATQPQAPAPQETTPAAPPDAAAPSADVVVPADPDPAGEPEPKPAAATATTQPAAQASPAPAVATTDASTVSPAASVEPAPASVDSYSPNIRIHGFVSEGGFVSTANDYIGRSSRGSLELFEGGLNVVAEPLDSLRIGLQIVARDVGNVSEDVPRLDWAIADYRFRPWLGLRAGVIKIPYGLYNEYIDIDSARTAILLPQSLYPIRNRDALISHTGFGIYGVLPLSVAGELDYQAWLGMLSVPRSALELVGAELASVETRYATGGQLFWRPPVEGLRLGASYMRASIDFNVVIDSGQVEDLIASGALFPEFDGKLLIAQRPASFWVASVEYITGDWLFAAEYSRWLKHQATALPRLIPTIDEESERFYALASYRLSEHFELGTYASFTHLDVDDRLGHGASFAKPFMAFQRDFAATLRFDVNDYWLWKLEAHVIDGTAELQTSQNPSPTRDWGLFLLRTTVTF
jgi:hypothetical protein